MVVHLLLLCLYANGIDASPSSLLVCCRSCKTKVFKFQGVNELVRIIYAGHEDEKPIDVELSWICEASER